MSMNPIEVEATTPSTASGTTNRISITNPKSALQQQVFSVVSSSSSRHSLATSGKQYSPIFGSQLLYILKLTPYTIAVPKYSCLFFLHVYQVSMK